MFGSRSSLSPRRTTRITSTGDGGLRRGKDDRGAVSGLCIQRIENESSRQRARRLQQGKGLEFAHYRRGLKRNHCCLLILVRHKTDVLSPSDTAYPLLTESPTERELQELFTPSRITDDAGSRSGDADSEHAEVIDGGGRGLGKVEDRRLSRRSLSGREASPDKPSWTTLG